MTADLRHAIRSLRRHPSFAILAVVTLALGIGAATTIFSVLRGVVLAPLPFSEPDSLVAVWQTDAHNQSFSEAFSYPDFIDVRESAKTFTLAALTRKQVNVGFASGVPERLGVVGVDPSLFGMLGRPPQLGRAFSAEDDRTGAAPVVILGSSLWRTRFGGDRNVLGSTLRIDGVPHTVIGVAAERLWLGRESDLFLPLVPTAFPFTDVRGVHNLLVWGRLAPGVEPAAASEELGAIMSRLEEQYPADNRGRGGRVEPLRDALVGSARRPLLVLFSAVGLLLLLACANVAGLLLARGAERGPEMAVRASLGANRLRLVRQLLAESFLLAVGGGVGGALVAWQSIGLLMQRVPEGLPRSSEVGMDLFALLFAISVSTVSGVVFGVIPALRLSRSALSASLSGTRVASRDRMRHGLVVIQVGLAVLLTIGAALLLGSLRNLLVTEPGFDPQGLMTFDLSLPASRYPVPDRTVYPAWPEVLAFYESALPALQATPGVESAALAMNHPLRAGWTSQITIEGRPQPEGPVSEHYIRAVSPEYFRTVGLPLLRGRGLTADDRGNTPAVLLVNEAFARRYFGDGDPVGEAVRFWGTPRTIVGVVGDERFFGPGQPSQPAVYPPLAQLPMGEFAVVVKAGANPLAHLRAVRETLARIEPEAAPSNVQTLEQMLSDGVAPTRFQSTLLTLFSGAALLLASVGLFGLLSWRAAQRKKEIGIRMALGASRANIGSMMTREGLRLAGEGLLLGLGAAWGLTSLLENLLYGVEPTEVRVFGGVALLVAGVALVASWIPARRASSVEPVEALRND